MKIKCPNCNCEYEPSWGETNDCPICGYGIGSHTTTSDNTKTKNN